MIQINNLKFAYRNSRFLFDNLELSLELGKVYGLLGKNGAGKTTLLKIISGLLFPKEGQCKTFDQPSTNRLPEMLSDIYIIPEEFYLPSVSIDTYVKANSPFYKNFSEIDMARLLTEFGLASTRKLSTLSYGQKKKFLIAFGLATNARLLILDEPTNGLDIPSKGQFRKIIASALTDERSFLISTHQVRDLESIIDTVVIIEEGKIIFNYTTEKISSALIFKMIQEESPKNKVIYAEDTIGGKIAVLNNPGDEDETKIELELLFNGVLKYPELFKLALDKE